MVCSAPEMTTVSNPNRNPAKADMIDHRKIRTFMDSRTSSSHVIRNAGRPSVAEGDASLCESEDMLSIELVQNISQVRRRPGIIGGFVHERLFTCSVGDADNRFFQR